MAEGTDTSRVRVVGIGNAFRRDDGAGIEAVRRLRPLLPSTIEIRELVGDGVEIMDALDGAWSVIFVDAARGDQPVGSHVEFDAATEPIPANYFSYSTHAFSLAEGLELARVLGLLPEQVRVHAVFGADFSNGEGLSDAVEAGLAAVVSRISEQAIRFAVECEAR